MKKTISIPYSDIVITVHNKREDTLAGVIMFGIENAASILRDRDRSIADSLRDQTCAHWIVEDIASKANAMYHLDMIPEPTSSIDIWNIIANIYNHSVSDHFVPYCGNEC